MQNSIYEQVRARVLLLAEKCGYPNAQLGDDDIIPESGLLDSAAIIELVIWLEASFHLCLDDDDITISNLGSINRICAFVQR